MGRLKLALSGALACEGSNLQRPCASWRSKWVGRSGRFVAPWRMGAPWRLGVRRVEFTEALCFSEVQVGRSKWAHPGALAVFVSCRSHAAAKSVVAMYIHQPSRSTGLPFR